MRSEIVLSAAAIVVLLIMEVKQHQSDLLSLFNRQKPLIRYLCYSLLVVITLALGTSYTGAQQAFIYFQF